MWEMGVNGKGNKPPPLFSPRFIEFEGVASLETPRATAVNAGGALRHWRLGPAVPKWPRARATITAQ
jgi:hypothetical protein